MMNYLYFVTKSVFYTNISSFFYWDEYCYICKSLGIPYNFNVYFKYSNIPKLINIASHSEQYFHIFVYVLRKCNGSVLDGAVFRKLYRNGYVRIIHWLEKRHISIFNRMSYSDIHEYDIRTIKYFSNRKFKGKSLDYCQLLGHLVQYIKYCDCRGSSCENHKTTHTKIIYLLKKLKWSTKSEITTHLCIYGDYDILYDYVKYGHKFETYAEYLIMLDKRTKIRVFELFVNNMTNKLKDVVRKHNTELFFNYIFTFRQITILMSLNLFNHLEVVEKFFKDIVFAYEYSYDYMGNKILTPVTKSIYCRPMLKNLFSPSILKYVKYDIDELLQTNIQLLIEELVGTPGTYCHKSLQKYDYVYEYLTNVAIKRFKEFDCKSDHYENHILEY